MEEGPSDEDINHHLTHVTEATLTHDGSLILTDGTPLAHDSGIYPLSLLTLVVHSTSANCKYILGMVQIPVSMYNGAVMVSGVSQLDGQSLAIITPPKSESDVPPSTQTVEIMSGP